MKMSKQINGIVLSLFLAMGLSLSGCIKPEAPNAEADIEKCIMGQDLLFRDIHITNNTVEITVNSWVDVSKLAPVFVITDKATIAPENGSIRDFTKPQIYRVTSEDGKWSKDYTVTVKKPSLLEQPIWTYSFEGYKTDPYPILQELDEKGNVTLEWASGNYAVFLMSGKDFYVTQDPEGYKGNAAKLQTKSTGFWGKIARKPIAAGSVFMGTMDTKIMATKPLEATHFGVPFMQEPHLFEGYYKYTPGEKVINSASKVVEGKVDNFSLYAVFFETTNEIQWLDGTNVQDSPQLISVAKVTERKVSDKWVKFEVPFEVQEGKSIDPVKLKAGKYSLAIVASSSENGAHFEGAVGSTLWIDELQIFCK